jgi:hypothetical protein
MAAAWTLRNRYFGGACRKGLLVVVLMTGTCLAHASFAQAIGPAGGVRRVLRDEQLDSITSGNASVALDLFAFAQGPNAATSTTGSVRTARTTVLRVAMDPTAPDVARARLVGVLPADVILASGEAKATGDSNAQCSATIEPVGELAFITQASAKAATATSVTCSCAAFAIALIAH